jgi:gluconokinase
VILILMGVSGAGKSTIGQRLAQELGWPYYEGDDFHPQANIEKMSKGIALTDADRIPWLDALAQLMQTLTMKAQSAIITCSALKRTYRERLSKSTTMVHFVYLKGSFDLFQERLKIRRGHFMKPELLRSQFDTLEEPEDALIVDMTQTPGEIVSHIRQEFSL